MSEFKWFPRHTKEPKLKGQVLLWTDLHKHKGTLYVLITRESQIWTQKFAVALGPSPGVKIEANLQLDMGESRSYFQGIEIIFSVSK